MFHVERNLERSTWNETRFATRALRAARDG